MNPVQEKLVELQQSLKVPKGQFNSFGGFYYRSAEDIIEALKESGNLEGFFFKFNERIYECAGNAYVESTVVLSDGEHEESTTTAIREEETRPKMSAPQLTAGSISFARKIALGGLLMLDDSKDADHTNQVEEKQKVKVKTINAAEVVALEALIDEASAEPSNILERCKIQNFNQMPVPMFKKVIAKLEKQIAANSAPGQQALNDHYADGKQE